MSVNIDALNKLVYIYHNALTCCLNDDADLRIGIIIGILMLTGN